MPAKMIEAKPQAQQLAETASKSKRAELLRNLASNVEAIRPSTILPNMQRKVVNPYVRP